MSRVQIWQARVFVLQQLRIFLPGLAEQLQSTEGLPGLVEPPVEPEGTSPPVQHRAQIAFYGELEFLETIVCGTALHRPIPILFSSIDRSKTVLD